jgi:phage-related protein
MTSRYLSPAERSCCSAQRPWAARRVKQARLVEHGEGEELSALVAGEAPPGHPGGTSTSSELCYFWYTDFVAPWSVLFYADDRGREPVRQWLEGLERTNPKEAGTVRHYIDLLEEFGVLLEEPYSRQLRGRVRELRPRDWRVTYFADDRRRFVLLTSFRKKGQRTPQKEIVLAERLADDWARREQE